MSEYQIFQKNEGKRTSHDYLGELNSCQLSLFLLRYHKESNAKVSNYPVLKFTIKLLKHSIRYDEKE